MIDTIPSAAKLLSVDRSGNKQRLLYKHVVILYFRIAENDVHGDASTMRPRFMHDLPRFLLV